MSYIQLELLNISDNRLGPFREFCKKVWKNHLTYDPFHITKFRQILSHTFKISEYEILLIADTEFYNYVDSRNAERSK